MFLMETNGKINAKNRGKTQHSVGYDEGRAISQSLLCVKADKIKTFNFLEIALRWQIYGSTSCSLIYVVPRTDNKFKWTAH